MKRLACFLFFALAVVVGQAHAQYLIDVKTHLINKYELQAAKQGFMAAIEESDWGRVVETGEHFSLWIISAQNFPQGSSKCMVTDLELRTPAMLTNGRLLASRRSQICYDWNKIQTDAVIDEFKYYQRQAGFEDMARNLIPLAGALNKHLGLSINGKQLDKLVGALEKQFNKRPSPQFVSESALIGARMIEDVQAMAWSAGFRQQPQQPQPPPRAAPPRAPTTTERPTIYVLTTDESRQISQDFLETLDDTAEAWLRGERIIVPNVPWTARTGKPCLVVTFRAAGRAVTVEVRYAEPRGTSYVDTWRKERAVAVARFDAPEIKDALEDLLNRFLYERGFYD